MNNLCNILNIDYNLEPLDNIQINIKLKGFILNYNSINYLITLHKYYPIKNINIEDENSNMLINDLSVNYESLKYSVWNELLVIENFNNLEYKIVRQIKNTLPHKNQELNCFGNNLTVVDYCYNNINHLPLYPRALYIKTINEENNICDAGLPVFQKDGKLIGIVSDVYNGYTFIIPTYYIIKTLQKQCNSKIYTINNKDIMKIDKFNVTNNMVYHQSMSIRLPIDVYITLEGDKNKTVIINKHDENRYCELETRPISNENYLLRENENYVVNATLLIILKIINNRMIGDFINFIQFNYDNKILLSIKKNDILDGINELSINANYQRDKYIKRNIIINEIEYGFTMFV